MCRLSLRALFMGLSVKFRMVSGIVNLTWGLTVWNYTTSSLLLCLDVYLFQAGDWHNITSVALDIHVRDRRLLCGFLQIHALLAVVQVYK